MIILDRKSYYVFGAGIFFFLSGVILVLIWPIVFNNVWENILVLSPDSESYKLWIKTPMPLFLEIYLFNWTNSEEFLKNKTIKPAFSEVGPFVFQEIHEKLNISWNNDNTVTYNQKRTWYFIPEKSVELSVPITNLNVVVYTIAKRASNLNILKKELINFLIYKYKEGLIIQKPAKQWLFEGINDSLLNFIHKINPKLTPYDKFGWFYGRNQSSTYDGLFNVKTGNDDIHNLGVINKWNNDHQTKFFEGDCGIVQGSTSELFPPLKNSQRNLTLFISDFCSPVSLTKSDTTTVISDLEGYYYRGDKNVFDNGSSFPNSKCYCSDECSPSGVRNETLCKGAPVFISFPHFYLADSSYVNSVTGLSPNKSEHELYMIINPLTGLPLDVRAQFQINILLESLPLFSMFFNLPKIYLPMMWFRQKIELPEKLASMGKALQFSKNLGYGMGFTISLFGFLMVAVRVMYVIFQKT